MQAFYGNAISEHMAKLPDGTLLVRSCALARTGTQEYRVSEVFRDDRDVPPACRGKDSIVVIRLPEEVFAAKAMASAEGCTLTDGHPSTFISPVNFRVHVCGHVQNVRRSPNPLPDGNFALVGDLLVRDTQLAQAVITGQRRQLSLGYDCEYHPQPDGTLIQRNLVINHAAIVAQGRAGATVAIMDEMPPFAKFGAVLARAYDSLPETRPMIDEFLAELSDDQQNPPSATASELDSEQYASAMRRHWRK